MKVKILFLIVLGSLSFSAFSQTKEQSAWLAWFNSAKLSDKWGLHLDAQLRSSDDIKYAKNLLVRPGLTYFIDSKQNLTAGYAYVATFDNPDISTDKNLTEHRIWEQYVRTYKIKNMPVTHRFRLEQRFIERPSEDVFSQRLRYFARMIIPITKDSTAFTKGLFVGLQNEIFLNLQNKNKLNGHLFDQNRAYLSLGYRLSKKIDIEAGYLNQAIKGASSNTVNHVGQIALYTRF